MTRSAVSAAAPSVARNRRGMRIIVAVLMTLIMLPMISMTAFMVLVVGLLPSVVAVIVDRTPRRYAGAAVGGFNIAGVAPFLFHAVFEIPGKDGAVAVLTDPFALVIMYGAAAIGWALFSGIPALLVGLDQLTVKREVERLRARQKALRAEWGDDVVGQATGQESGGGGAAKPSQ